MHAPKGVTSINESLARYLNLIPLKSRPLSKGLDFFRLSFMRFFEREGDREFYIV